MKLQTLIDELQQIAHMGHAQDEVLFTDLTNERGTKMLEALRPRLLGYTACDGKISLRIHDERAPSANYEHPKVVCEFCHTPIAVQPLYKYTDSTKVWNHLRSLYDNQKTENVYVCPKCAKELMEAVRD